jgi:hypothetical protein
MAFEDRDWLAARHDSMATAATASMGVVMDEKAANRNYT